MFEELGRDSNKVGLRNILIEGLVMTKILTIVTGLLAHPRNVDSIFIVVHQYHMIMEHKVCSVSALWPLSGT